MLRITLCSGAGSGHGEVPWDLGPSTELGSFLSQGHSQAVRCLRFSPDGKWLASAADDHTVKVTRDVGMQAGPRGMLIIPRLCPDPPADQPHVPSDWLGVERELRPTTKGTPLPLPTLLQLWDLTAGKMMSEFPGHTGPVNVVEFHPNEYLLASGSSDR